MNENGIRDCTEFPELIQPCTLKVFDLDICTPTVASQVIDLIALQFPLLSEFAFWGEFVYLGVYLVSLVAALIRRPKLDPAEGDDEVDEAEDEEGLLEG